MIHWRQVPEHPDKACLITDVSHRTASIRTLQPLYRLVDTLAGRRDHSNFCARIKQCFRCSIANPVTNSASAQDDVLNLSCLTYPDVPPITRTLWPTSLSMYLPMLVWFVLENRSRRLMRQCRLYAYPCLHPLDNPNP